MRKNKLLLGYYNYTVILTYIGMISGFAVIVSASEGLTAKAVYCLMLSGLCDMFDGKIASTKARTNKEKCFGIQIDSLSDLISFGVLPAFIVYTANKHNLIILSICALYLLAALIRLAYYNVDEQERITISDSARDVYYGLPVTLSAIILPLSVGVTKRFSLNSMYASAITLLFTATMFLIPVPFKKPGLFGKIVLLLCGLSTTCFVTFTYGGVI